MIRIVLDTNVLVSALLRADGSPAAVLMLAISGKAQLCVSDGVYSEYDEVIRRPRFSGSPEGIEETLRWIRKCALWVKPKVRVQVSIDPDDDIFLECAQAARADYLVRGNLKHFPREWGETKVIGPRALIEIIVAAEE